MSIEILGKVGILAEALCNFTAVNYQYRHAWMKKFHADTVPDLPWRRAVKKPIPIRVCQVDEAFTVETLEGTLSAKAGDYLVVGVRGEMYAIDREIFTETYDWVSDEEE